MEAKRIPSPAKRPAILDDAAKGPGLLFGVLLILCIFGLVESIVMFWKGRLPNLVELLVFGLLAADAIILMIAVGQPGARDFGWLGLLSVWVLGLIPYFIWVVIYAGGRPIAAVIHRRQGRQWLVAGLIWIAVVILCLGAFLLTSRLA